MFMVIDFAVQVNVVIDEHAAQVSARQCFNDWRCENFA